MNNLMLDMASAAMTFADKDIELAKRMIDRRKHDMTARGTKLRAGFSTRRLESAKMQIDAAIALLRESEDE